jgi:hypothetical protein
MVRRVFCSWALLLWYCGVTHAGILGFQSVDVDLTKPEEAKQKADWSPKLDCTPAGLGFEGQTNASRDGWMMTRPLGIGTSWRPTTGAHLRVKLSPPREKITLPNGMVSQPGNPAVFARYGCDGEHWSDWQPLKETNVVAGEVMYDGMLRVAAQDRERYAEALQQYVSRDDVPWSCDEEAFCRTLVAQDRKYFAKQRPFIGYVQFLVEDSFPGQQRLTQFHGDISWSVGGIATIPKDPEVQQQHDRRSAWGFRLPEVVRK